MADIYLLLTYQPRKDEWLTWPSSLTSSGHFTHKLDLPSYQPTNVRQSRTSVLTTVLLRYTCSDTN